MRLKWNIAPAISGPHGGMAGNSASAAEHHSSDSLWMRASPLDASKAFISISSGTYSKDKYAD